MPVLPLVGSMMVPPGCRAPDLSESSTMDSAMRSLIEPPGLPRSDLIHTLASGPNRRLMRTCGVLPMVCRMLSTFMVSPERGRGMAHILNHLFCSNGHMDMPGGYHTMCPVIRNSG